MWDTYVLATSVGIATLGGAFIGWALGQAPRQSEDLFDWRPLVARWERRARKAEAELKHLRGGEDD